MKVTQVAADNKGVMLLHEVREEMLEDPATCQFPTKVVNKHSVVEDGRQVDRNARRSTSFSRTNGRIISATLKIFSVSEKRPSSEE